MAELEFYFDSEPYVAGVKRNGESLVVTVGEQKYELVPAGPGLFTTNLNGKRCLVAAAQHRDSFHIDIDSVLMEVTEPSEEGVAGGAGGQMGEKDKILAPMPGKVVKIQVEVGQAVTEKQPMVIVEAMKMENQVIARAAGTVKAINFAEGDQVDTETPIIELELDE